MQYLFIDESGSMTKEFASIHHNFVICVVRVKDIKNLRKLIKRFIKNNFKELKLADSNHKMFKNNIFQELKGSALSRDLKIKLAKFLCNGNILEVYYINLLNEYVPTYFYEDTSRIYNYLICLLLEKHLENKTLPFDDYLIDVDERNLQKIKINSLEDYLNIELKLKKHLVKTLNVCYYDSKDNLMVQVSDFFSNLYFSYLKEESSYASLFRNLFQFGYLKDIYIYPENLFS